MRPAVILGAGRDNHIFNEQDAGNRDDCYQPYIQLRDRLRQAGYDLRTPDRLGHEVPAFQFHFNAREPQFDVPAYLLYLETDILYPSNARRDLLNRYRRVFTWNDSLVDGRRFVKVHLPNPIRIPRADGFEGRDLFCCLIAGNKVMRYPDERELYTERVRAIRWFEAHAPDEFRLFGIDWDTPPRRRGRWGKMEKRLWKGVLSRLGLRPFPSYRGTVGAKRDVLSRARFSLAYENVRDVPGYITEKIFDCFFAGCVPVYRGAGNVTDYIPADCFIDRRDFADTGEVYRRLKAMGEAEFVTYQENIVRFLGSEQARAFSSARFAETIAQGIVGDLEGMP